MIIDDPLLFYHCGSFLDMRMLMFSISLPVTVDTVLRGLEETVA